MKFNKFIKFFLPILLLVNFTIFNKAIAQVKISDAFTGAVKRDILPSQLPKMNFKFNSTVPTKPNIPNNPNGVILTDVPLQL